MYYKFGSLKLGAGSHESLACFVCGILVKVLDETRGEVLGFLFPLGSVSVSVAWIKYLGSHTFKFCRYHKVEIRYGLGRSLVYRVVQDGVNDTTCVADGDTLAGTVPASVHQVSLGTVLFHLLNQLLRVLCWVQLEESLAEASGECRRRLCYAALCSGEFGGEAGEEVILGLLRAQDRHGRQHAKRVGAQEDHLLGGGTSRDRLNYILDVVYWVSCLLYTSPSPRDRG